MNITELFMIVYTNPTTGEEDLVKQKAYRTRADAEAVVKTVVKKDYPGMKVKAFAPKE